MLLCHIMQLSDASSTQGQGAALMQLAQCWASCHSVAGVHNIVPIGHTTEWYVLVVVSAASWQHGWFLHQLGGTCMHHRAMQHAASTA